MSPGRRPRERRVAALVAAAVLTGGVSAQRPEPEPEKGPLYRYLYRKEDLGAVYGRQGTTLKLWAPTAESVNVVLFPDAHGREAASIPMTADKEGIWSATLEGDHEGEYYLYDVTHRGGRPQPTRYRVNDP